MKYYSPWQYRILFKIFLPSVMSSRPPPPPPRVFIYFPADPLYTIGARAGGGGGGAGTQPGHTCTTWGRSFITYVANLQDRTYISTLSVTSYISPLNSIIPYLLFCFTMYCLNLLNASLISLIRTSLSCCFLL